MSQSISQQNKVSVGLKHIFEFYQEREFGLYRLLKKHGITDVEIAKELGVTKGRVNQIFKEAK